MGSLLAPTQIRFFFSWPNVPSLMTECTLTVTESPRKRVTGRFGPIPVRTPGRFGPIPFRSRGFGLGRFGPISGVGRFGPILAGRFGPLYNI